MRLVVGVAVVFAWLPLSAQGATFHVAPTGSDAQPGTAEQPLATLEAARDAARKAQGGPHRIVLMPGDYFLAQPLELDARDNGLTLEAGEEGSVTLYGGTPVTAWQPDGDRFWYADLPGVKEGTWDFRALVVNGRLPERARIPESGTLEHQSVWNVRYLTNVGGDWERKPTPEDLTTLLYNPQDIPPTLDPRNAELRVYHMWDESLVGLARNDTERHAFLFSSPAVNPPGAFGVKKYVIFNTREGMTHPGQWYLDRTAGRVVYWPLPGEDMAKAKVIAPRLERLIGIAGTAQKPVEGITLRGFALAATTTPLKPAGFGANQLDGAVRLESARRCTLEKLQVSQVGGQGLKAQRAADCRIADCHIHHTGGCGLQIEGSGTLVAGNHVHHVGIYHPSAVAMYVNHYSGSPDAPGPRLYRNEVHDGPYSGIIASGRNFTIEENLIYRVMQEMHDGAAIYGNMADSVIRGNMVRDVVPVGSGYGASAYYLDEGAHDCLVERNVAFGVPRPTHNHIARNITLRDNVFIAEGAMELGTTRSSGIAFERNTLYAPGGIQISAPNAIASWKDNVVFRDSLGKNGESRPMTIDGVLPPAAPPGRRTATVPAVRAAAAPSLDGEIGIEEWPGDLVNLDREPSRWSASGAPVFAELAYDDQCLYVAVNVVMFDLSKLRTGAEWGKDDGAEIAVAGQSPEGKPATLLVRGFAGGTFRSATDAGAPAAAADRLSSSVRFTAKVYGKTRGGWRGEWAIPFEALGIRPAAGAKLPFNLSVYRSEDGVWRCWEGTLAETWRLEAAGTLELK